MKRLLNLLPFLLLGGLCSGQLTNDGGTIVIQAGATLYVESDVINNIVGANTGTITVNGELEIQGHLTNNATMTTSTGSLVKFSGNENSNVKSNGAVIENLQMAKNGANGRVTLTDSLTVKTNLDFQPSSVDSINHLVIGTKSLILSQQATTITDPTSRDYIEANAAGKVQKTTTANATFMFPIGDATKYSPVTANYTGTGYSSANVAANVVASTHPNKPTDGTDFIARYWNVDETGVTDYDATLTGEYAAADVTGTSSKVMGATQPDMSGGMTVADWTFTGSDNGANLVKADVTGSADLTGFNFFGKANLTVYLSGALASSGVPPMTINLNSILPMSTPYNVAPWNAPIATAPSIPATATDWILVEARDATVPATLLSQTSGFLLSNGSIVNVDGSPLLLKDSKPTAHISLRHRNHLGIRTLSPLNLAAVTTTVHNFTTGTGQAYTDGSIVNANMKVHGSSYAMWKGDVNSDSKVQYNGGGLNDRIRLLQLVGSTTNTTPLVGYGFGDVDLNGSAQYNGGGLNDRIQILQIVGSTTNTTPILGHL